MVCRVLPIMFQVPVCARRVLGRAPGVPCAASHSAGCLGVPVVCRVLPVMFQVPVLAENMMSGNE